MRIKAFTLNGRQLNIVAVIENDYWVITVRENGHNVGRAEYRVSVETAADALTYSNAPDLVDHLMDTALRDAENDSIGVRSLPA